MSKYFGAKMAKAIADREAGIVISHQHGRHRSTQARSARIRPLFQQHRIDPHVRTGADGSASAPVSPSHVAGMIALGLLGATVHNRR